MGEVQKGHGDMSTQVILLLCIALWVCIIGAGILLGRLLIGSKFDKRLWEDNLPDEWNRR